MKIFLPLLSLLLLSSNINAEETKSEKSKILPIPSSQTTRSIIVIEPKKRSEDIKSIVAIIRKDKPTAKIYFKTTNGLIQNILEIQSMTNGTSLLIKTSSLHGVSYETVFIENILEIGHS